MPSTIGEGSLGSYPTHKAFSLAYLVVRYTLTDSNMVVPLMKNPVIKKKIVKWKNHILSCHLGNWLSDGSDECDVPLEILMATWDDDKGAA